MLTVTPLPAWPELAALAGPTPDPARVAAPWLQPGDRFQWFSRSAWALHALVRGWARQYGRQPRLWVPAFFCNATLDPVRRAGVMPVFYPVADTLDPDWEPCRRLAGRHSPDLFVLVHYFGRPADTAAGRAFCAGRGALLIEDCAHVLRPEAGIGAAGDFVLWSPHKLLPVPQGGLLVLRDGARVEPAVGPAPALAPWLIKRVIQKLTPAALLPDPATRGPQCFDEDPPAQALPDTPALAPAALKLLGGQSARLGGVAARRREIAGRTLELLRRQAGWAPLYDPATITPYRLVMRCAAPDLCAERYRAYRAAGVPVESWPDLAPEVAGNPARHAVAVGLRHTLLCLPVHQGLDVEEMVSRCAAVRS